MMSMTSIKKIPDRFVSVALLVVGASLISFSAVFVKLAEVGPTIAGFYRFLFGGLILSAIVLLRGNELWKGFRPFLTAAVCGLFLALDTTLWHRSIHAVGPGLATILANFQVFFLAGFGVLVLRERLTWRLMV
ncbi:MAG: EamA family transporter, partial [candidate division Zixibacteria bacterium]|nr:EamA family transporter [candidate division Zixibacteria bacterium]